MAKTESIRKEQWETAGLTDSSGSLSRRVPHCDVFVPPTIKVRNSQLRWSMDPSERISYAVPEKKTFDGFIKLWTLSDDEDIAVFSRKWGILQYESTGGSSEGTESIHVWRELSRRACAVANIAADLRSGSRGRATDWGILGAIGEPPKGRILENRTVHELIAGQSGWRWGERMGVERLKDQLAGEVNDWLRRFSVGFALRVQHNAWELTLQYRGLAAAMALQLAVMVSDTDLFVCSACHFPYVRSRSLKKPGPRQNNYCPNCQPRGSKESLRGAGQRKAEESYRLRKRVKRMHSQGHKMREIAAATQKSIDVIRRLVRSQEKQRTS